MKTNFQNTGLKNRSEQLNADNTRKSERRDNRLPIDRAARYRNRCLNTDGVLNMMVGTVPDLYLVAEVVGRWVWIEFAEAPAAEIRQRLLQIGFHWNRRRQAWQHPCGLSRPASSYDPRVRYGSYFPAHSYTAWLESHDETPETPATHPAA